MGASSGACTSNCATYALAITAEDLSTGDLVCDARVTLAAGDSDAAAAGRDDAAIVLDASATLTDAEIPPGSNACQWDVTVSGGTYEVVVTSPGFALGSARVVLSEDECGSVSAPVMILLTRR